MNNLNEINPNTFSRYYSIELPRQNNGNDVSSIAIDRYSQNHRITEKKKQNKDMLLTEVQFGNQRKKVSQLKNQNGLEVSHRT